MSDFVAPIAKTVAALLVPIVLALVGSLARKTGVDIQVDAVSLGTAITAAITAIVVWVVPNKGA